jgi:hypothetical protein
MYKLLILKKEGKVRKISRFAVYKKSDDAESEKRRCWKLEDEKKVILEKIRKM